MKTLEFILPLRNPTEVLQQTARSIASQTNRDFSVLISDNFTTKGGEWIAALEQELQSAGVAVRRVKPPFELGRVEHWNWAHHQAQGEWVKPVFAGDWLEPGYVAAVRDASAANPGCRYIFTSYILHRLDESPATVRSPWVGRFFDSSEMKKLVLSHGMQFGPPSAAAYELEACLAAGGYPTTLPICSDSLLFCAMASRHGALGLAEPLCHFNIHGARFSTGLPAKRKLSFAETLTYYWMLGYQAWSQGSGICKVSYLRLLLREFRSYRRAGAAR